MSKRKKIQVLMIYLKHLYFYDEAKLEFYTFNSLFFPIFVSLILILLQII